MKMAPLSVCLIVHNEESRVERALRSAAWADEIIVMDSGSTDRTAEICRRYTDKVYTRPFDDYASQKNAAVSRAAGKWILSLDADEEITSLLKNKIEKALQNSSGANGYRIRRRSRIFGRFFRFSGTQADRPLRFFRKGAGRFEGTIHESLVLEGRTDSLDGELTHYTYDSLKDYMSRFNRYTGMEAERFIRERHKAPGFFEIKIKPWLIFFWLYLFQQGFRDGREGFQFCVLSAFYTFVKHLKHFEKLRNLG